ncbi:MAG: aldo/keto reductase [Clostridia bacterium]|nr:aldo/keto reductase [Christensenellaceae bacterium]MBR6239661.1 aldo/keto reductase [Clostridia bacterium]
MNYPYCKTLNNGVVVPQLGLGTWKSASGKAVIDAIKYAVDAGYRSIDTAKAYRNEESVGEGIRTCGIPREELYVTTKIWNGDHGFENTIKGYEGSMERLDIGYIDELLIHWPTPKYNDYVETFKAMEMLYEEGKVRAIGVCNFTIEFLEELRKNCHITPAVNQIEMHPMLIQHDLMDYCSDHGILIEAYSPLMNGGEILHNELIAEIGRKYGKTNAQVTLRFLFQLGVRILTKSVHKERIIENQDIFDFELSKEDMERIATLNKGIRTCGDPNTSNFR